MHCDFRQAEFFGFGAKTLNDDELSLQRRVAAGDVALVAGSCVFVLNDATLRIRRLDCCTFGWHFRLFSDLKVVQATYYTSVQTNASIAVHLPAMMFRSTVGQNVLNYSNFGVLLPIYFNIVLYFTDIMISVYRCFRFCSLYLSTDALVQSQCHVDLIGRDAEL